MEVEMEQEVNEEASSFAGVEVDYFASFKDMSTSDEEAAPELVHDPHPSDPHPVELENAQPADINYLVHLPDCTSEDEENPPPQKMDDRPLRKWSGAALRKRYGHKKYIHTKRGLSP
jgi:hypothetical protein